MDKILGFFRNVLSNKKLKKDKGEPGKVDNEKRLGRQNEKENMKSIPEKKEDIKREEVNYRNQKVYEEYKRNVGLVQVEDLGSDDESTEVELKCIIDDSSNLKLDKEFKGQVGLVKMLNDGEIEENKLEILDKIVNIVKKNQNPEPHGKKNKQYTNLSIEHQKILVDRNIKFYSEIKSEIKFVIKTSEDLIKEKKRQRIDTQTSSKKTNDSCSYLDISSSKRGEDDDASQTKALQLEEDRILSKRNLIRKQLSKNTVEDLHLVIKVEREALELYKVEIQMLKKERKRLEKILKNKHKLAINENENSEKTQSMAIESEKFSTELTSGSSIKLKNQNEVKEIAQATNEIKQKKIDKATENLSATGNKKKKVFIGKIRNWLMSVKIKFTKTKHKTKASPPKTNEKKKNILVRFWSWCQSAKDNFKKN